MLKQIKKDFELGSSAYPPFISLTQEQVEWLIEQAEKVEELDDSDRAKDEKEGTL